MSDSDKLGTPVDFDSIPQNKLRHTGLSLPHPSQVGEPEEVVSSAYDINAYTAPFKAEAVQAPSFDKNPQKQEEPAQARTTTVSYQATGSNGVALSKNESQVLKRLKEKFGIVAAELKYLELEGFKFGFRVKRNGLDISWAIEKLRTYTEQEGDQTIGDDVRNYIFQVALLSVHLATMDDVPLYKHFGISTGNVPVRDQNNPPSLIRLQTSEAMFSMLMDGMSEDLVTEMFKFYNRNILENAGGLDNNGGGPLDPSAPLRLSRKKMGIFFCAINLRVRCEPPFMTHASWRAIVSGS